MKRTCINYCAYRADQGLIHQPLSVNCRQLDTDPHISIMALQKQFLWGAKARQNIMICMTLQCSGLCALCTFSGSSDLES